MAANNKKSNAFLFILFTGIKKNQFSLIFIKSRLIDNTNPSTGEPFGEDFLENGVLDLNGKYKLKD